MNGALVRILAGSAVAIALIAWFAPGRLWLGGLIVLLCALFLVVRAWRTGPRA